MKDQIWLAPFYCVEGEEPIFTGPWLNIDVSTVDMTVYDDAVDVTTSKTTGTNTVSNNVATYKQLQNLEGGKTYVINFQATASDAQVHVMKMEVVVEKAWTKLA